MIIKSIDTARGNINIREATLADAVQFRELRLFALQESPTAFSADYEINFNHPMSFWESRLTFDEHGIIFFVEHNSLLIGMTGIRKGELPKRKRGPYIRGSILKTGTDCAFVQRVSAD